MHTWRQVQFNPTATQGKNAIIDNLCVIQVAKLLVEAGANQGIKNKEDKIPLQVAKPEVNLDFFSSHAFKKQKEPF